MHSYQFAVEHEDIPGMFNPVIKKCTRANYLPNSSINEKNRATYQNTLYKTKVEVKKSLNNTLKTYN